MIFSKNYPRDRTNGLHRVDFNERRQNEKNFPLNLISKKTIQKKIVSKKYTGEILNCKTQIKENSFSLKTQYHKKVS